MVYGFDTVECIVQTCKDLIDLGYVVVVVIDAVSSFRMQERNTGLVMLRDLGVELQTFQSLAM